MLAPISWRVPPRHYGPWEQFVSLLTEGLVAPGRRRDALRDGRLDHPRTPGRHRADRLLRGSGARREGLGVPAHLRGVRAGGRVRPDPQQLRLPAAHLQRARRDARRDDDPRLLVASDPARLREVQRATGTTSRSATPTGTRASTTSPRSITASTCSGSKSGRGGGGYLLFFGRIHPDKGTVEAIEIAAAGRAAARHRRDRPGPRLLRASCRAAYRRRAACSTSGRSRPADRSGLLGEARGAAAPRQLRGAVRVQRRRGDGLRDAGDRHRARVDAGDRPRRENGSLVALARRGGRGGRGGRDARPRSRSRVRRAPLRVDRMVDEYLDVYAVGSLRQAAGTITPRQDDGLGGFEFRPRRAPSRWRWVSRRRASPVVGERRGRQRVREVDRDPRDLVAAVRARRRASRAASPAGASSRALSAGDRGGARAAAGRARASSRGRQASVSTLRVSGSGGQRQPGLGRPAVGG